MLHCTCDNIPGPNLQFTLWEKSPEELARHLLLLAIAFDWSIPIRQRAVLWLEIHSNAKLPERSSIAIARARLRLIKLLSDEPDGLGLHRILDLSALKYKDRDALIAVCKSWALSDDFPGKCSPHPP